MTAIQNGRKAAHHDPELVETLRAGFAGRPAVAMSELSNLLKLDEKTLLRHIRSGRLPFRSVGTGRRRIRRLFTMGDVVQFFDNLGVGAEAPPAIRSVVPRIVAAPGLIGTVPRPVRRNKAASAGASAGASVTASPLIGRGS